MSDATLLLRPAEAATELRISTRQMYEILKGNPQLAVEIPGMRGLRVSRQRLAAFVDALSPAADGLRGAS